MNFSQAPFPAYLPDVIAEIPHLLALNQRASTLHSFMTLIAMPCTYKIIFVRDWYIGCAQPSQGCERGPTPLSRFHKPLLNIDLYQISVRANFRVNCWVKRYVLWESPV